MSQTNCVYDFTKFLQGIYQNHQQNIQYKVTMS